MHLSFAVFRFRLLFLTILIGTCRLYAQNDTAPQITQQPSDQYAFVGGTAKFSLVVTGAAPLSFQWFKGTSPLTNQTNATLTISNVRVTNAGIYYVNITNQLGSLDSSNAVLNVAGPLTPPIELISLTNSWRFDQTGRNLGSAWRALDYDDSSFAVGESVFWTGPFRQSLPADGNTSVETDYNGTRVNTYYFRTHFNYPFVPTNVLLISSNLIDDGAVFYINGTEVSRLRMTSGAFGYQTFAVNAPNNGLTYESILFPAGIVHTGDNQMAVEVHQSTAASSDVIMGMRFLAYAGNSEPLQIYHQPPSKSVPEESAAVFRADVFGGGNVTYQWYKNTQPLPGATNQILSLPFVHPPDGGEFWFAATNAINGVVSDHATLTIIPDIVPPAIVGAYITNDFTTIAIVFSEPLDPQSVGNFANYFISPSVTVSAAELVSPDVVKLTISGFDPQLAYTISAAGLIDLALPPNQIDAGSAPARIGIGLDVPSAGLLAVKTVFVIVMENQDWADIQGNPACPYINNVIVPQSSYCTQFHTADDLHPSEPNYIWMEAGTNFGIFDDSVPSVHRLTTTNHLVTQLQNAGISWKTYQENVTPGRATNSVFPYLARHNPFVFFDDVITDLDYCTNHIRPFSDLAMDLTNGTLARYNFITPNQTNDMHDLVAGSSRPAQGDLWLSQQLPMILNSPAYTSDGAIFITWDEGNPNGPIGMMVLSPQAKGGGYHNSIYYNHSSLLRSMQEVFQVRPFLENAAFANTLSDLFIGLTLTPSQDNGLFAVKIENALPGRTNYLQSSSDFVHWTSIHTNVGSVTVTIPDPDSPANSNRFYRVLQLP